MIPDTAAHLYFPHFSFNQQRFMFILTFGSPTVTNHPTLSMQKMNRTESLGPWMPVIAPPIPHIYCVMGDDWMTD